MRIWIFLLIALLANFALAKVIKRQAGEVSDEVDNALEESTAPSDGNLITINAAVDDDKNAPDTIENEAEQIDNINLESESEEQVAEEENAIPQDVAPVNDEEENNEESPEAAVDVEGQEMDQQMEGEEEEQKEGDVEIVDPSQDNIDAEIDEETEMPVADADETEQPAGSEPTEEQTHTSDSTGQTEITPAVITSDVPKADKAVEAAALKPWTDSFGWIHYPWKKLPLTKFRYSRSKDCGCQVKWIKKVYKRYQPKPIVKLIHHSSYVHPRRRTCRRPRNRHHIFQRKPCGCNHGRGSFITRGPFSPNRSFPAQV